MALDTLISVSSTEWELHKVFPIYYSLSHCNETTRNKIWKIIGFYCKSILGDISCALEHHKSVFVANVRISFSINILLHFGFEGIFIVEKAIKCGKVVYINGLSTLAFLYRCRIRCKWSKKEKIRNGSST